MKSSQSVLPLISHSMHLWLCWFRCSFLPNTFAHFLPMCPMIKRTGLRQWIIQHQFQQINTHTLWIHNILTLNYHRLSLLKDIKNGHSTIHNLNCTNKQNYCSTHRFNKYKFIRVFLLSTVTLKRIHKHTRCQFAICEFNLFGVRLNKFLFFCGAHFRLLRLSTSSKCMEISLLILSFNWNVNQECRQNDFRNHKTNTHM